MAKMNIGSSLASLVAATCISMGACAQSQLTLCNENPTENISTAVIYRVNQPFDREWVAYGWVTIAPNKCVVVAQTPSGYLEVFLSTLSQDIHGGKAHIMHFAFNEFSENNSTASERFFAYRTKASSEHWERLMHIKTALLAGINSCLIYSSMPSLTVISNCASSAFAIDYGGDSSPFTTGSNDQKLQLVYSRRTDHRRCCNR
ncbi:DUF1036 domain-containing protein [Pseudomonas sp. GT1P32]